MPPLQTARQHFAADIQRSRSILACARLQQPGILHDDILRASWMMSVGSADAYFCDAYADVIARTLRAKDIEATVQIPDRLNDLKVPVTAVIRGSNTGWRWRMAARELIEDQNVLSLEKVRHLLNHFFAVGHKIVSQDTIANWLLHRSARRRRFGITATQYRALPAAQQAQARKTMLDHFESHYEEIFQRRHDCIHNCDRPKTAIQPISDRQVEHVVEDIEYLVDQIHNAITSSFPVYLQRLGFNAVTRNRVLQ